MKQGLLAFLLISTLPLYAQERGGPEGNHEDRSWSVPSFSGADFIGGANLNGLKNASFGVESELLKRDKFNSTLEVNTNRGSLSVDFSLPLPSNLLGKKSISFEYNHRQKQNIGLGVGFNILLPALQKSLDGSLILNSSRYVKVDCEGKETCYKATLENDFSVIYQKANGSYLYFSRGEKHMNFNSEGNLTSEFDNFNNEINYEWDEGKLVRIVDKKQNWDVSFNYIGEQEIPVAHGNKLVKLPKKLTSISFKKGNDSKKVLFSYQGEYLTKVNWENGKKNIFKASYQAVNPEVEESSLPTLGEDEIYITQEDPNVLIVKTTKKDDNVALYLDLNNDYRLDKFEFDSKAYKAKVETYLKNLEYDVKGESIKGCEARPKKPLSQVKKELSDIEVDLDFYWAMVTEGKNFEYVKDNRLSGGKFKPGVFLIEEKKSLNDNCHNVFYYSIEKISFKRPFLVNQNSEEEKALVWITPQNIKEEKLAKRIYKMLEEGKVISAQKATAEVWKIKTDKEKLARLYPKFGTIKKNVITEVRSLEKTSNLSIARDAIVLDLNNDGLDDIFEGDRVLLQNNKGEFETFDLGIEYLKTQFELDKEGRGEKYFLINEGEKIKVVQGEVSFSLRDFDVLDSKIVRPGSNRKLIQNYETPFGGKFEVQYKNQNKTQLVSKIIKKDDERIHHERDFEYTSSMFDFYTGTFIGFEKTFEKISSQATDDQKVIERNFLADAYPSVVLFEQRARLQGRIFAEIHSTTSSGDYLKKTWTWDGVELDSNRIYPYTTKTSVERLNGQGKTTEVLTSENEILEWEKFDFIKSKKVTSFLRNDLISAERKGELRSIVSRYSVNEAGLLLQDSKQMSASGRELFSLYSYNEQGKLIHETQNKKNQRYEYDEMGRLLRMTDFKGLETNLRYNGLSPEALSFNSGDEEVSVSRSGVFSLPLIQKFHGKEYIFSYNADLENSKIELLKNGKRVKLFEKGEFEYRGEYLLPKYQLSLQDKNYEVELDQFGEPIKAVENFHGKKRILFENFVVDDLVLKGQTAHFEGDIDFPTTNYSYNAKTELLSQRVDTYEESLHYINKYVDGCSSLELNGNKISINCKNLLGQIIGSSFLDEQSQFRWGGDGILESVNDSHSWAVNSDFDLTDFKYESDQFSQNISSDSRTVVSGNKTRKLDEKSREVELHLGKNIVYQTYDKGFLTSLTMTDSFKNIHEENYSYEFGNLKTIKSKKFEKHFKYDEFERVVEEKTSALKNSQTIRYEYKEGEIVKVTPFVKNIVYDANLRISSIQYENGLVANFMYERETEVIKSAMYKKAGNIVYGDLSTFNELSQLLSHQVIAPRWGNKGNSFHSYNSFVLQNGPKKRNFLEKESDLSHCGEYVCRDREFEFFSTSSLGLKLGRSIRGEGNFLFINSHEVIVDQKLVKLVELKGLPIGVAIGGVFYPAIVGHKKEILGLINPQGEKLLFLRKFDLHGNKELITNGFEEEARQLDSLTVWSFGRLRHNPLEDSYSKSLYFSLSRAYSTKTGQWTSVDPLVAWGPQALVNNPGNWNPYSYCNGDPVNCVDPSGYYTVFAGSGAGAGAGLGVRASSGIWINKDPSKTLSPFSGGYYSSIQLGGHYGLNAGAGLEGGFLTGTKNDFEGYGLATGGNLGPFSMEYSFSMSESHGATFSFDVVGGGVAGYQHLTKTTAFEATNSSLLGRAVNLLNTIYNKLYSDESHYLDYNSDQFSFGDWSF